MTEESRATDIVERLNRMVATPHVSFHYKEDWQAVAEASAEIIHLRSELESANDDCRRANELINAAIDDYNAARERADNMQAELEKSERFLMALRIAHAAHDGQTDKTGADYILHPLRVSLMGESDDDRVVGMLHDVVEDCPEWSLERLAQYFPRHIIEAIEALTKRQGEDYTAFIERVKLNGIAARVKMNDIADNMDPARLNKLPPDVGARLQRKYSRAIRALQHTGEKG